MTPLSSLPKPHPNAEAASHLLQAKLKNAIAQGGWLSFADFMHLALYAPDLGYYTGDLPKFGEAGDFVTAPEISPLFGQTLAVQASEVMRHSAPFILELGAGTGRLAADLLASLEAQNALPEHYFILEVSGSLRARQEATLQASVPHLLPRVVWQDRLPDHFSGFILANEVLDAMPVHLALWQEEGIFERGVGFEDDRFVFVDQPAKGRLLEEASRLAHTYELSAGYVSEINLFLPNFLKSFDDFFEKGVLLLIDYGFSEREFYHPERHMGTLMCHYQHHAHTDPFFYPGLQDITAHVNFSALAKAGFESGFALAGYTHQAAFLMNVGLLSLLEKTPSHNEKAHAKQLAGVQKLISPAEMGALFKVMALAQNYPQPLRGFSTHEQSLML